jgi:hypothetical protein
LVLFPLVILSGLINYRSLDQAYDVQWMETARELSEYQSGKRDEVNRPIIPRGWNIKVKRVQE